MNVTDKALKNANITIVANRLHTSFISPSFFTFLPNPTNIIQLPPFGFMDFGKCNFIVDVENRRVVINHISGNIIESPVSRMAQKFLADVQGLELIAVGFNYIVDVTCDSEFRRYSIAEFLNDKYKQLFGDELAGVGFKVFIKKTPYMATISIDPNMSDPMHAVMNANFHCEIPNTANLESDFIIRYNELEGYINGIFS